MKTTFEELAAEERRRCYSMSKPAYKEPSPLPPMEYTMKDFKKWCELLGYNNVLDKLSNFTEFTHSSYCLDARRTRTFETSGD